MGHRLFAGIGIGFVIFEMFFLTFYGSDFWFDYDISLWGLGFVVIALTIAHILLTWLETPAGCRFVEPIWKGRPPVVYGRWITLDESGITFGNRHVVWNAVDGVALTIWGNVLVRSRAVCGPSALQPDLVLKFPLGVAPADCQTAFIDSVKAMRPDCPINQRLLKRLTGRNATVKGTAIVQSLGGIFMLVILFDVGNSTFTFLQMMKEYYLAQTSARDGESARAVEHFKSAEAIFDHPLPVSWVTNKFLSKGVVGAGVHQARSEALWRMGRKEEAIEAARKPVEFAPDHFRFNLRLARLLAESGHLKEARQQIRLAIDNHDDTLLPRLYMIAMLKTGDHPPEALKLYGLYIQQLIDIVFGDEPLWPPGGNRYCHELIYLDDATFVFDRLIGKRASAEK